MTPAARCGAAGRNGGSAASVTQQPTNAMSAMAHHIFEKLAVRAHSLPSGAVASLPGPIMDYEILGGVSGSFTENEGRRRSQEQVKRLA